MLRSPSFTAERHPKTDPLGPLGWAAALLVILSGCRGAAYRDVYRQQMASEIRVLEDQLYDADYQNQVLREELMRFELKESQIIVPQARPRRTMFGKTLNESGEVVDAPPSGAAPRLPARPLQAAPLPETDPPSDPDQAFDPGPALDPGPPLEAAPAPRTQLQSPRPQSPPYDRLVPPSEPVPPGPDDLMIPDVELGDPVPPPSPDAVEAPPGRIDLPDTAKRLTAEPAREPVAIRINPGLSGGHKTDDAPATEGIFLVVEAIDDRGSVVSLDSFEIDAELSIVLLDPARTGATARLGKWDFGPEQIRELVHRDLASEFRGSGLQVVIPWGEARPEAASVIAHVRLAAGDTVMQTQAEIATAQSTMAHWTPRAAVTR